ncbi:MAG: hypothetical protein NVS3B25_22820 [Hymenobacter sp.]
MDPFSQPNQNAVDAQSLLNCGLLAVNSKTKMFEPMLAEAMPLVSHQGDSLTGLTYRLRPVARWDDGHFVTAADVAFTLKMLYCAGVPNEQFRIQTYFIADIKTDALDPRRFTLLCQGQAPSYVNASGDFPIICESVLDPKGELRSFSLREVRGAASVIRKTQLAPIWTRLAKNYAEWTPGQNSQKRIGCGPYLLKRWGKDQSVLLVRKKHWWGDQVTTTALFRALPGAVQYLIIPEETTAALALRSDKLDLYPNMAARVFEGLQKSPAARRQLAFYASSTYEVVTAGFNTSHPVLHDATTRRALSFLFDAKQLNQVSQLGEGLQTVGIISPLERRRYNNQLPLLDYNPAAATALLPKAGWRRTSEGWFRQPPGEAMQQLKLQIRYRTDEPTYGLVALQFASAARAVAIAVDLLPTEPSVLRVALQKGDFDVYVKSINGNPFLFNFEPLFGTHFIGESNYTRFGTPTTDQQLRDITAAKTEVQQEELLRAFQAMIRAEMPLVPLFFVANRVVASRALTGVKATSLKPGYVINTISRVNSRSTLPKPGTPRPRLKAGTEKTCKPITGSHSR